VSLLPTISTALQQQASLLEHLDLEPKDEMTRPHAKLAGTENMMRTMLVLNFALR
jgi:hypothetical protein